MKKKGNYYVWIVVTACVLFETIALGLGTATSNLYVKPICDDMHFSRSSFALVFSIMSIFNTIASLTFGFVHKKIGVHVIFLIGVVTEAAAFFIYYSAQTLSSFYLGAFLMGIGLMYLGAIPLSLVVGNWFIEKRGTILGIVFAGSGIGGMILNPLISSWIIAYGWRQAYFYSFLIVICCSIPALLLIREKPSDIGLKPYGAEKRGKENNNLIHRHNGLPWKEAVKHPHLWLSLLGVMLFGVSIQGMFLSTAAFLNDRGIQAQLIGFVMSIVFFSNLAGKVLLGIVNDRFGIRPVIITTHTAFLIAAVILVFTNNTLFTFLFAIFFGIAGVMLTTPISIITSTLFGDRDYSTIFGMIMASFTIGVSIGTPVNGLSFDLFSSYSPAFIFDIILETAAALIILGVLKSRKQHTFETEGNQISEVIS